MHAVAGAAEQREDPLAAYRVEPFLRTSRRTPNERARRAAPKQPVRMNTHTAEQLLSMEELTDTQCGSAVASNHDESAGKESDNAAIVAEQRERVEALVGVFDQLSSVQTAMASEVRLLHTLAHTGSERPAYTGEQ